MTRNSFFFPLSSTWIVVLFSFCLVQVSAQPGTPNGEFYPQGEAGVDYNITNKSSKKEGQWIRVWPNGNLYYCGQFENGTPKGGFRFFYEDGRLMSEVNHIENGRKAFTKLYRPDGSLQAEGMYMTSNQLDEQGEPKRLKQGEWKYYDANNRLRLQEGYNLDELHGITMSFGANGQKLEHGSYVQGERDGKWVNWDELGTKLSEINYRNGRFHGMCTIHFSNGRPQTMGMYQDGVEIGFWKQFMDDGTLQTTRQFDQGNLVQEIHENGPVLLTFSDGRPKEEFTVVNQKKSGPFKEWHDVGEWIIVEELDEETGEVVRKRTLTGEAIRREGEYKDGKLDGDVYHYNLNGRLHLVESYANGTLQSSEKQ